ncbi:MAG: TolC family protein [Desulfobacteraceae bacterium]|jgi:outer membrane protein TolC|nr:MAG: TolC family protein [Desulfobacteraceae bacterium]
MFKGLCKAGETAIVLALMGFGLSACAGLEKPDVPKIEKYLTGPAAHPVATGKEELLKGERKERPVRETGENRPLTLETCVRIALDKNPLNRAAQEGIAISKESVGEARAPYYPEIGVRTGYGRWQKHAFLPEGLLRPGIPSTIGPTDDWSAGLEARFTLFDSGKRRAQLRAANALQGAAEEDASRIRQDIALEVHNAFFGLVAAEETRSIAEKTLERTEDHLRLVKSRYAVGAVAKADVLRAQVEVANAKLTLVRTNGTVRIAQGNLNTSMGLPVEMRLEIEPRPEAIISPTDQELSDGLRQAVRARPVIKHSLYRIAAAEHGVSEARSAFGPTLRADGGYGWRDEDFLPEDEEWLLGVSVEFPIFTGFSRKHKLGRKKAELRKEEAEIARLIQDVQQEVWAAYWKLEETYQAVEAAKVLVLDAEESMRSTRARYEVGADTITELLDAQTALARAEATHVETQWDYYIGKAVYKRAVGSLSP